MQESRLFRIVYYLLDKGKSTALELANFVLDKSLLSTREKEQILMALQGIIATEPNNSGELLTKLVSLFQTKNTNKLYIVSLAQKQEVHIDEARMEKISS